MSGLAIEPPRAWRRQLPWCIAWLAMLSASFEVRAAPSAATATAAAQPSPRQQCLALRGMELLDVGGGEAATRILEAQFFEDRQLDAEERTALYNGSRVMSAPESAAPRSLPAHCHLRGYVNPSVQFEMRLPAHQGWNRKFLLGACNGFCGRVEAYVAMTGVLRRYATMTTDGGHVGDAGFDAVWARDNLQARIDFGYRANHVALLAAKAIIRTYYGGEQRYSYITGCSKGGQAGVMAALRYPQDFQGVIARGPTIDYTGVNLLHCAQKARAVYQPDGGLALDASRHELIKKAVLEYCDPRDGLKDGLISDPRKCDFDPQRLRCRAGESGAHCLGEEEASALRSIYSPVRDERGVLLYPGADLGSEANWGEWVLPRDGSHEVRALRAFEGYLTGVAFLKAPPPDYDWRSFDWARDRDRLHPVAGIVDATNPDLRPFRDAGGKMIVVHGWSDEAIPASASIKWYEDVSAFMGGRDAVAEFARLFLLPGVNHCGSDGIGPSTYDALVALEDWVEKGEAPDMLLTRQEAPAGPPTRSRPVYAYPIEARYRGRGSIDEAGSFVPQPPANRRARRDADVQPTVSKPAVPGR